MTQDVDLDSIPVLVFLLLVLKYKALGQFEVRCPPCKFWKIIMQSSYDVI